MRRLAWLALLALLTSLSARDPVRAADMDTKEVVARGLDWLAKQQKKDGSWVFDGSAKDEVTTATGMALLPFLAAGETHKNKEGKYQKTVESGLKYLLSKQKKDGSFAGPQTMYGQAIASLAVIEAYGAANDPVLKKLSSPPQKAFSFIAGAQAGDGGWRYSPGAPTGDMSVTGWQVQVLHSAKQGKGAKITLDKRFNDRLVGFLDKLAVGEKKSAYGYDSASGSAGTTMTAVGLYCRHYASGWGADELGMREGLLQRRPDAKSIDLYHVYYVTLLTHAVAGEPWKTWYEGPLVNGARKDGLRDILVGLQVTEDGAERGSWKLEARHIGKNCGRVGTTALSLLTLQVADGRLGLFRKAAPE